MDGRVVLAIAVGVIAIWGYQHYTDEAQPSEDVFQLLAQENWGNGYCYDHEWKWPCIVITDIQLDRASTDWTPRGENNAYRACFDIYVQFETTPWDVAQGVPSDPRQYIEGNGPLSACADVYHFTGPEEQPNSWTFVDDDARWWRPPLDALKAMHCGAMPTGSPLYCP